MYKLSSFEFDHFDENDVLELFRLQKLTMGDRVREFEASIAKMHKRKYAVMVNSGSSANLIGVGSLVLSGRLPKGSKVLVPAVSWSTTYFPLEQYGLISVFADVSLSTFGLNVDIVKNAIKKDPDIRAVFFVPLLGNYEEAESIRKFCVENNLLYIEDCCEAFGSSINQISAGELGLISTFSFYFSHQLPTIEGGMVLTDDRMLYDYMLSLRAHGWTRDLIDDQFLDVHPDSFIRAFRFVLPGYCLRPTEINAVLGINRLKKWPHVSEIRAINMAYFAEKFSDLSGIIIQSQHHGMSAFGFGIIVQGKSRAELVSRLTKNGVEVRPIVAGNFLKNPVINMMQHIKVDEFFSNAETLETCGLFFGNAATDLRSSIDLAYSVTKNYMEN